jgi:hypothetical protein
MDISGPFLPIMGWTDFLQPDWLNAVADRQVAKSRTLSGVIKDRFPEDFMFRLTREEIMRISQCVISSAHPGVRTLKFSKNVMAFTEHGVAMLSSVL